MLDLVILSPYVTIKRNENVFEAIAGCRLGEPNVSLFVRVGDGIYTKPDDVGADFCL